MTLASNVVIGLDIGGTKISACLVDQRGQTSFVARTATPAQDGAEAILSAASTLVEQVIQAAKIVPTACGIGSAGTFDTGGRVLQATNHLAGWTGTDVSGAMAERLRIPVVTINDVHAAAFGELWFGIGRGQNQLAMIAIGTGIGGAIVVDGRVLRGNSGRAGAVGHIPVTAPTTRMCSCGGQNHLEAFASGPGIERTYLELAGDRLDLPTIGDVARQGDATALAAIQLATDLLADVLADLITVLDPGSLVLGGGVLELGKIFLDPVVDRVLAGLQVPLSETRISVSSLGNQACMIGASALALRHLEGQDIASAFA